MVSRFYGYSRDNLWLKAAVSLLLVGMCVLVVLQLEDASTSTHVHIDAEKDEKIPLVTAKQIHLPSWEPVPEYRHETTKKHHGAKHYGDIRDQEVTSHGKLKSGDSRRRTGDGFGLGKSGGIPTKSWNKLTPCHIAESDSGHRILKNSFDPKSIEYKECQKRLEKAKEEAKKEDKNSPLYRDTMDAFSGSYSSGGDAKETGSKETKQIDDKYHYRMTQKYQWCTFRLRNGHVKVRGEASECEQPKPCPTTCGHPGSEVAGKIFCETIVGKTRVADKFCAFPRPPAYVKKCAATGKCYYHEKTTHPKCPTNKCDSPKKTVSNQVVCKKVVDGSTVSDSRCKSEGHTKPKVDTKHCAATDPCPVKGYCNCGLTTYAKSNYQRRRSSYHINTKNMAKPNTMGYTHLSRQWNGIGSIFLSSGCQKITVQDDDEEEVLLTTSGTKSRQDQVYHGSIKSLPYDLEDDVKGIRIFPKYGCVKHCATSNSYVCP